MKNRFRKKVLTLALFVGLVAHSASAKEVKFEASLDRDRIALGETAQLGLSFYETQSMPAPDLGAIDGLEIRYIGPSTMMTVINGQMSSSVTHRYALLPLKLGKFNLGPFSFTYKGNKYTSNMVVLEATEERIPVVKKEGPDLIEKLNLEDRIFMTLKLDKLSAYVNELVPLTVKLYVNRLNVSDIQLPIFSQEGFSKIEFKEPKQYREMVNGIVFDVLEFKTNIFGTRPGDFRVGPAKIKCNVVMKKKPQASSAREGMYDDEFARDSFFEDFFTRYERHPLELKSGDAQLIISPLPTEGMPKGYSGAVGDYQFIFDANPKSVKVGDPITLRMEINGTGNFNTVLMPKLENTEGFKIYEPQVNTDEHTKSFKEVIIPETDQIAQLPKATFSYFDPNKREYRTITQGGLPIKVEKGKEEAVSQVIGPVPSSYVSLPKEEETGRDIIYIKEIPGRWAVKDYQIYRRRFFASLVAFPLLFIISLYFVQLRQNRLRTDAKYAGRIAALKAAKTGLKDLRHKLKPDNSRIYYESLFATLQNYLGNRLNVPPAGVTYNAIEQVLLPKEVEVNILRKLKNLFEICDRARFAGAEIDEYRMKDDLKDLEEIIRYLERRKA